MITGGVAFPDVEEFLSHFGIANEGSVDALVADAVLTDGVNFCHM